MTPRPADPTAFRMTMITIVGSLLLAAGLFAVYVIFGSQIALAQAADSLSDTLGGAALLWAARESVRPPDEEHPQGHGRAAPIGALVVAVLIGVLAVEVFRTALGSLLHGGSTQLDWPVAIAFLTKVVFKGVLVGVLRRLLRTRRDSVLSALASDSRNDVLVGVAAIVGFALDRLGLPRIDAFLALGISVYIGRSGLGLGRENVSLLLGESTSSERREELSAVALAVPGVRRVEAVVAVWHGSRMHVQLEAIVDGTLSLAEAHAIGHAVEQRLLDEPDVNQAIVHVGPA